MSEIKRAFVPVKLTRERLGELPVVSPEMTVAERRRLCVDFFHFTNSFLWVPVDNYDHYVHPESPKPKKIRNGKLYGGLCYTTCSNGNVYRVLDYYDEQTGVFDAETAFKLERNRIGCQCSSGIHWAWSRVQNTAWFGGCSDMVEKNGCRKIGPYQYDPELQGFSREYGTNHICQENGEQVMYESYAQLQPGDGLVCYTTAGHVIMPQTLPWVQRNEDGTIDGARSHILFLDQSQVWKYGIAPNGDEFAHMPNIATLITFEDLLKEYYLPITLDAFREDYIPETPWLQIDLSEETVTAQQLCDAVVTSNYSISDIYVIVSDEDGSECYSGVNRSAELFQMRMAVESAVDTDVLAQLSGKAVRIECQSGSGIREVLYKGVLK